MGLEHGLGSLPAGREAASAREVVSDPATAYLDAATAVQAARLAYAEAYLRAKVAGSSDGTAHQQAITETRDELTMAEAVRHLAAWRLSDAAESAGYAGTD